MWTPPFRLSFKLAFVSFASRHCSLLSHILFLALDSLCFDSFPSAGLLVPHFRSSQLLCLLNSCKFCCCLKFLLQYNSILKRLDQPPLSFVEMIFKNPAKKRRHSENTCLCQPIGWSMAAMLGNSVVVVVRTRPRAIPLAMKTMRKSFHGFPFLSHMSMGLRLAALRAAGAPLLTLYVFFKTNPRAKHFM